MVLVDTSVWVDVFRDASGARRDLLRATIAEDQVLFTRFAARIYFDLRRQGETVRSPIDCCIAQLALAHEILLLHRDEDFNKIARIRPLHQSWVSWED